MSVACSDLEARTSLEMVAVVSRPLRSVVESRRDLSAEMGNGDAPCLRLKTVT